VLLTTALSTAAACLGFLAALCFCIGSLTLSASQIRQLAATKYNWNPHIGQSLAGQKAEYVTGALLLAVSFLLQLWAIGANPATVLCLPQSLQSVPLLALAILLPSALDAYGLRRLLYAITTRKIPGYKPPVKKT